MKTLITLLLTVLISISTVLAQVAINTDGSVPDNSAILDIKSTTKGLLIPRMTNYQISLITSPAGGLFVYSTDDSKVYCFNSGDNEWKEIDYGAGSIAPFICGVSSITDIEGNSYNTVLIDSQCWMAENLVTTKYNDGTDIPYVTDGTAWMNLSTAAYAWYNNDEATYGNTYGALYNWHVVNSSNICPNGWHVPTTSEWTSLTTYLGGVSIAGGKLKESGTEHWDSPNLGATNESGFTSLPAGERSIDGAFRYNTRNTTFWSANEVYSNYAWYRSMNYNSEGVNSNYNWKSSGYSIRCLLD